jgi:hypothetical protein
MLPRTRQQQQEHKRKGKITGYFKLPRGRPPSVKLIDRPLPTPSGKLTSSVITQSEISSLTEGTAAAAKGKAGINKPAIKKRGNYVKWSSPRKRAFVSSAVGVPTKRAISGAVGK